jgi:hypothetical protein
MGRQLRRVALDFAWPHNKVWQGFINPHYDSCHNCDECHGTGYSPEAYKMYQQWWGYTTFDPASRGSRPWTPEDAPVRAFAERNVNGSPGFYGTGEAAILREGHRLCSHWNNQWMHHMSQADVDALVAAGELQELTHTWSQEDRRWHPKVPAPHLTAAEVNAWTIGYLGSNSSLQYHVAKAECARLGVSATCAHCNGEGSVWDSPEAEKLADDWQPEEPPAGPGYQLWETVSEGSPISPVFATPEELASWLVTNPHGIDEGTTFEQWMTFICGDGWAPSMAIIGGQVVTGVVASGL